MKVQKVYCRKCRYYNVHEVAWAAYLSCIHPSNVFLDYNGKRKDTKKSNTELNKNWNCSWFKRSILKTITMGNPLAAFTILFYSTVLLLMILFSVC